MAPKALPRTSIDLGAAVLAAVDNLELEPEGAFWLYDDTSWRWHFYIISSLVDVAGPRWMFLRLNRALPKIIQNLPRDFDLRLGSPNEVLSEEVRRSLDHVKGTRRNPVTVDFGDGSRNLVVYRINSAMSDKAMHRTRVKFRRKLQKIEEQRVA